MVFNSLKLTVTVLEWSVEVVTKLRRFTPAYSATALWEKRVPEFENAIRTGDSESWVRSIVSYEGRASTADSATG